MCPEIDGLTAIYKKHILKKESKLALLNIYFEIQKLEFLKRNAISKFVYEKMRSNLRKPLGKKTLVRGRVVRTMC